MKYSIIIPVYNRPEELDELLASLDTQSFRDFEVVVVEDGSSRDARAVVKQWAEKLPIRYYYKENSGQGFSRNYGFERAQGDYFLVFDSDALLPDNYFELLERHLADEPLDAFGGPDKAHANFTPLQKAISYSMTSPFTTGGIRGGKKRVGAFHPRSFNMGISREVWEKTGGYSITRMGEDIIFSLRIIEQGFKVGLVPDAFVYHKRRTSLKQFFRQLHFFGRARINIGRFYPKEVKLVHAFPSLFTIGILVWLIALFVFKPLFWLGAVLLLLFSVLILISSLHQTKNLHVALLSILTSFTQLMAYGIGFLQEGLKRIVKG